jgi:hypothetical protein
MSAQSPSTMPAARSKLAQMAEAARAKAAAGDVGTPAQLVVNSSISMYLAKYASKAEAEDLVRNTTDMPADHMSTEHRLLVSMLVLAAVANPESQRVRGRLHR